MQTKHQIESLLASAGVEPNKRLGQNFLIDLNLMRLLIGHAEISKDDVVIEVGCGTGSFTEGIAEQAGAVIVVEYDTTLARIAGRQFEEKGLDNIQLINSDVLESKNTLCAPLLAAMDETVDKFGGKLKLVANLPYSVATSVMINLAAISAGQSGKTVDSMFVTVQKEVGERMVAPVGDRHYGVLSILMAATGKAKIVRKLPPDVFWPKPQIESAMVEYRRDPEKAKRIANSEVFKETVNLFMGHRRKMLKACTKFASGKLKGITNWGEIFEKCNVDPTLRAEKVTAEEFIKIANECSV
jgi:16S rRNA (adenine1518-N6/adenine1519-N6)-dimethyltransferase